MRSFGSRMHSGGRGGRGGSRGGGRGHSAGGYRNDRFGAPRGGGQQHDDDAQLPDTMTAATTGFFSDMDPNGRYARYTPRSDNNNLFSGRLASAAPGDEQNLAPEEAASIRTTRNTDQTSGKQTQDSVLWIELGLCKALTRAVSHLGYLAPTPVQAQAIPAILSGADCCVRAVTGSGKTAAFVLPMLHQILTRPPVKQSTVMGKRKYIRGLVLVPSRELGVQCHEMTKQMMQFTTEVRLALAIGGIAAHAQEAALEQAPEMVIATPGRFVDILHNFRGSSGSTVDLSGVEMVCLDECDKMLTIILKEQVLDILERVPPETRQMLLFSATMTSEVDEFAKQQLFEPKNIDIGHVALASQLRQQFVRIKVDPSVIARPEKPVDAEGETDADGKKKKKKKNPSGRRSDNHNDNSEDERMDSASDDDDDGGKKKRPRAKRQRKSEEEEQGADDPVLGPSVQEHMTKIKTRYLTVLCEQYFKKAVIIFTKYRTTAHRLQKVFVCLGLKAAELQGNQLQEERFEALRQFVSGEVQFLFCTDVASRGLDIKGIATVINFDLPSTLTAYIHRVGRTARIGESGTAVSLVHETLDADIMRKILTVSGNINEHQVASVKRRDVPDALLAEAVQRIDAIFPRVREILAAEQLAEKIAMAEKMLSRERNDPRAGIILGDAVTAKPKKEWCLSKKERKEREEAARKKADQEAEVVLEETQQELAELGRQESKFLQKQKSDRKYVREKKLAARERELTKAKEERKKYTTKVQAGAVKAMKKKKIRDARKAQRATNREKKGHAAFKHRDGKQSKKKSRHSRGVKKH